ncbi:hypothetical protein BU14_1084s0003 [Porphyra umbilicalis]|uniref:ChrR-like cupin domain-containing protein n=1 Tax=Porphyra umbilicalis TaxID=2786 RepID=A0A1X6NMM9_PORUM|nr:hypothetical protein BU14_1084s0003 [Porphyra umbilicalis]|eukprot:OSX69835.1 hypothetical protein BU14_1084s0003 [Porphyra umbilicalis]
MKVNADFSARVLLHAPTMPWVPSPMPGVDRRMLDRVGGEVARATSIVRYAPRSAFSRHTHTGGEEFLVLDGVFSDEHGDYPAGTYIRNPPTSAHTPSSAGGCTIFVKLWQFDPADRTPVVVHMDDPAAAEKTASATAAAADAREAVSVEAWAAGAAVGRPLPGGAEVLVLAGSLTEGGETLRPHSWLRLPPGGRLHATAGPDGARVWVKTGHLLYVAPPAVG